VPIVSEDLINKLREFIEKYCYEELLESVRGDKGNITIEFNDVAQFDPALAQQMLENCYEVIESAEKAIEAFDIPEAKYPIRFRVTNLPKSQHVMIKHIRSKHLGKFISTDGLIRQASGVRPKVTVAIFECPACGATLRAHQTTNKFQEPSRCARGRKGKFKMLDKVLVDVQKLVIEESPETLEGGEQPKRISVFLEEDLVDPKIEKTLYPGNRVVICGVVKEVPVPLRTGGQSTTYELLIDTNSVANIEEQFDTLVVTPEELVKIKELSNKSNVVEKLVKSIAPSIYGHDAIKEAILLQLFGGVQKIRADGTKTRGDIHVFLIGDPGSGKSQMLKHVESVAPKARYVSGKGASAAGLTATVVRDEFVRGWALEAGALVLANKGLAILDELDKMTVEDQSAMHEALEQQTVTIAKANIHATLRAQTSVLAAANPKFGRFDPYSPIPAQIDLPPTLINRFDLIFPIRDIPDADKDEKIASHVLELSQRSDLLKAEVDLILLKKYVAHAKQNCFPTLTQGAIDEIKTFYVNLRSAGIEEGEVKSIPISARQLEALVRLAEANAKIRLSDRVTKKDAQRAISLLRSCMEAVAMDIETGKFDIDRITSGITAKQRGQIHIIRRIIDMLSERVGKSIPISDIITEAENEGLDRNKVEEVIDKLKKKGDIFEPRPGVIQKIS
jgi:replicative DNA helicase Mcm